MVNYGRVCTTAPRILGSVSSFQETADMPFTVWYHDGSSSSSHVLLCLWVAADDDHHLSAARFKDPPLFMILTVHYDDEGPQFTENPPLQFIAVLQQRLMCFDCARGLWLASSKSRNVTSHEPFQSWNLKHDFLESRQGLFLCLLLLHDLFYGNFPRENYNLL